MRWGGNVHGSEQDVASAIAREIADQIGQERFDLWFQESTKLDFSDKLLTVRVPNGFFLEWLKTHYNQVVCDAATNVCGRRVAVRFRVDETLRGGQEADPPSIPAPAVTGLEERREPTVRRLAKLEDYVVGPCNQLAHAAACRVCEQPGQEFQPLFIHGGVGLGKTHLLEGICSGLRKRHRSMRVAYLSAEEFTNGFLAALRGGSLPSFRMKYRGVHALLIDGLQFLSNKRATQEEFLHTFKCLESAGRQVVVAADMHPRFIKWHSAELASRVVAGMTCALDAPDFETRLRILKARVTRLKMTMPDRVIRYIAEQVVSSVRELEGALNTLGAYSKLMGVAMDLKTAKRVLAEAVGPGARRVRLNDIEQEVCSLFGLDPKALKSKGRTRTVSRPRMVAMYLARKHTQAALSEIGSFFGGRNHSTVISAQKKVDGWLQGDSTISLSETTWKMNEVVEHLERRLCAS